MSTGPILDHVWLFAAGVLFAPVLGSALVTAGVRWWAARRGYAVEGSRWSLAGVVLALFVLTPVAGGLILGALRGIPPGLGFGGTLLFLFGVYAGPVLVGTLGFAGFVSKRLAPRDDESARRGPYSSARSNAVPVVTGSGLWFVAVHLALFPAVFAVAIAAS